MRLAPVSRLMSVGDVVVDYDQQYERYDPPRPAVLQQQLATTPPGLSDPIAFGPPTDNISTLPMLDETYYALPPDPKSPSPIVTYTVDNPRPIVRGESLNAPTVIDGDAVGLVDAADVGLLDNDPTIFYAGTLQKDKSLSSSTFARPANLVVTDSNRKQAFEWNSLDDNTGYTETKGEKPSAFVQNDPGINLFPGAGADAQTTTSLGGVSSVTASAYGTAESLRSEWRPANALDGNPTTAWETEGDNGIPNGNWWQVALEHPTTTDQVTLLQPQPVANKAPYTNQWITQATLTFDGKDPVTVDLGPGSRTEPGQVVHFPARTFNTLRVRIDQTNLSNGHSTPPGSSLVGLAEVGIGTTRVTQTIVMPTDLLDQAGAAASTDRLTYLFSRDRVAPVPPRQDPEVTMVRQFQVPSARTFQLAGTARVSDALGDSAVDQVVGRTGGGSPVTSATSSGRMPGDLAATASATIDDDPATSWSPGIGTSANVGSWLDYSFDRPETVDHLDLQLDSDAEHSRPTSITVTGDSGSVHVPLPPVPVTSPAGSTTTVPVSFPPVSGTNLRVTFDTIDARYSHSYETSLNEAMPIAVAEIGIPGVLGSALPPTLTTPCRSDLLAIDGKPVSLSISGSTTEALSGQHGLAVSLCGPDSGGIVLSGGTHRLTTSNGAVTGFNLDQLAIDSPAEPAKLTAATTSGPGGGTGTGPGSRDASGSGSLPLPPTPPATAGAPTVRVTSESSTRIAAHVTGASAPFLFVLGQSVNHGWSATVSGVGSLGTPTLVDGFANGWVVDRAVLDKAAHGGSFDVTLRFTPQRSVDIALVVSGATVLACAIVVAVALVRRRRRKKAASTEASAVSTPMAQDGYAGADMDQEVLPDGRLAPDEDVPDDVRPVDPALVHASPSVISSWFDRGAFQRSKPIHAVIGTVLAGAGAWALAGTFAGVVTAVGIALTMSVAWGRLALRVGAFALMAAGALDVVAHQARYHYPPAGWPTNFDRASTLIWGAVMLLAADAVLCFVRRFRAGRLGERRGRRFVQPVEPR